MVSFDPKYTPGQIVVSFGDRRLYNIIKKGQAMSYPIAVPREQSRWQGATTVSNKRENPSWRPTPDMLKENPKLPSWVPGGHPMNPLGVRAMYLGASLYRIHGTDAPWTIGQAVSKGCIRMTNEDVLDLYPRIPVGTRVTVTWERFSAQSVASSYDDAPKSYGNAPQPFQPAAYKSSSTRRTIRNLPPVAQDDSVREAQTAAVRMEEPAKGPVAAASIEIPVEKPARIEKPKKAEATDKPVTVKTASKAPEPKPTASLSTAKADKTPSAATSQGTMSQGTKNAIEAARAAAAAAAKAAEAAREAADAAKKAAEDARKATSTGANEPAKVPAKRAAL
jgi:hypothetical protein